ncbi:hypothetical protein Tco_1525347 [Tanacetum coccineum]
MLGIPWMQKENETLKDLGSGKPWNYFNGNHGSTWFKGQACKSSPPPKEEATETEDDHMARCKMPFPGVLDTGNIKFTQEHAWRILKTRLKWVNPDDPTGHPELFSGDVRERPPGDVLQSEFRRKHEATVKAYEVMMKKYLTLIQCKELEFLTLKIDGMLEAQAALINRKKLKY